MGSFSKLVETIKTLRSPEGCPWDKEQTFQSLIPHLIEESYELVDALESEAYDQMKEELGDVLLQVVMLSNMAEEVSAFSISDVIRLVTEKMIRRHPHVFGEVKLDSVDDVWAQWDTIKKGEKSAGIFDSIPHHLPQLMRAQKSQKKAARQTDIKPTPDFIPPDIQSRLQDIKTLLDDPSSKQDEELAWGKVLFGIVQHCAATKIDAESALKKAVQAYQANINAQRPS